MNEPQKHLVNIVKACIRAMYEWRNIPHHVIYIDMLSRADSALDDLDESGFSTYAYYHRLSAVVLRFRRKCYLVKFSDANAPHHCRNCGDPTGTNFRVCRSCMASGHIRQQERAQNGVLRHVLPKPRPRRPLETEHQETASQRFLRRFGACDGLSTMKASPRAMKNPLFTASDFPPAYVPSPKVAGGVFSSGSFRQLLPVDFQGAVLVTPPLCPMGGTFRLKNDQAHCFSGQCFRGSNAD